MAGSERKTYLGSRVLGLGGVEVSDRSVEARLASSPLVRSVLLGEGVERSNVGKGEDPARVGDGLEGFVEAGAGVEGVAGGRVGSQGTVVVRLVSHGRVDDAHRKDEESEARSDSDDGFGLEVGRLERPEDDDFRKGQEVYNKETR